jgi:hypothetical protein
MASYKITFLIIICCVLIQCSGKDAGKELGDSERFALEYPLVGGGNIFVYRNASETADILANGRGIVFMGFKECPWCQFYAVFLHDVARELEVEKIYYFDVREDRQSNSENYRRIVNILSGQLQYDDEGRPGVYVPALSIVSRGRIILHDYETSKETFGYSTPQEYWNDDQVNALKERLRAGIKVLNQIINRPCNTC